MRNTIRSVFLVFHHISPYFSYFTMLYTLLYRTSLQMHRAVGLGRPRPQRRFVAGTRRPWRSEPEWHWLPGNFTGGKVTRYLGPDSESVGTDSMACQVKHRAARLSKPL